MKKIIFLFLFQLILFSACQQNNTDDAENLKTVLIEYFDGVKTKDFKKMKDLTTPDFLLYENGKIFNNDSLINTINKMPKFTVTYSFDNFNVDVDKRIGTINYFSRGDFVMNDTTHMTINWMESATFKKVDDQWKLAFLHSTKVRNGR